MHLVHTYIAYRVSNICSVYRSGLLYVPVRHSYLCVRYAHQSANAVSRRGGVYSYMQIDRSTVIGRSLVLQRPPSSIILGTRGLESLH